MGLISHVIKVSDLLDKPKVSRQEVEQLISGCDKISVEFEELEGPKGGTLLVKISYRGDEKGRSTAVIGRLGGVGARPHLIGLVSDADGAIVALSLASKIASMCRNGDEIPGSAYIVTHISTHSPVRRETPVPMMDSPVDVEELLKREASFNTDSFLSVDATKANKLIKVDGFAITPVIVKGWILSPSDDVLDLYTLVTGRPPAVVPITMQDIVPLSVTVKHINSILQPWLYTNSPVMGIAITSRSVIPGSATGVTNVISLEEASRYVLEVVKKHNEGSLRLYREEDLRTLLKVYGELGEIFKKRS